MRLYLGLGLGDWHLYWSVWLPTHWQSQSRLLFINTLSFCQKRAALTLLSASCRCCIYLVSLRSCTVLVLLLIISSALLCCLLSVFCCLLVLPQHALLLQLLSLVLCILWLHYFRWCLFLAVFAFDKWHFWHCATGNGQRAANLPQSDSFTRFFPCSLRLSGCLLVCLSARLLFCELFAFPSAISKGNLNYF